MLYLGICIAVVSVLLYIAGLIQGTMLYLGIFLAFVSVLLCVGGLIRFFRFSDKRRTTKRLLDLTIAIVFAIFAYKAAERFAAAEHIFPSGILIELMQSFSLDADYSGLLDPFPGTEGLPASLSILFKVILYSSAPIVGGAVIYDVLAGVSPELRLLLLRRRKLLIFSELNEKTVTLAENLVAQKPDSDSSAVVFTDCYPSGDEESSELSMRAKNLRAVCLQADLLHCDGFQHSAHCSFFLMDEDETGNLDDNSNLISLRGLLNLKDPVWNRELGCTITMFTDSDETIENARALKKAFDQAVKKQKAEADKKKTAPKSGTQTSDKSEFSVQVHVIRDLATACCLHLNEAPMYETLSRPGQTLDVVIFGATPLASELFRTIFWCGQLLDHPLRIAVVAPPNENSAGESPILRELRRFNPELLESCKPDDPCLSVGLNNEPPSPPYASLYFITKDPSGLPMRDFLSLPQTCQYGTQGSFALKDAQRFYVAIGSDEENVALADELRRALIFLRDPNLEDCEKQAICVAVGNKDYAEVIQQRFDVYAKQDKLSSWLALRIFGCLGKRYSREIVTFDSGDLASIAEQRKLDLTRHSLPDIASTADDLYNEWSGTARSYHLKYKLYCAGVTGQKAIASDLPAKDRVRMESEEKLAFVLKHRKAENDPLRQDLRWLEHRRWCAFLRSEGFSRPVKLIEKLNQPYDPKKRNEFWHYSHKNVPSRTHPCLAECLRRPTAESGVDLLDKVNILRHFVEGELQYKLPKWPKPSKIKSYDSSDGEYGPTVTRDELLPIWDRITELVPENKPGKGAAGLDAWLSEHKELKQTQKDSHVFYLDLILDELQVPKPFSE